MYNVVDNVSCGILDGGGCAQCEMFIIIVTIVDITVVRLSLCRSLSLALSLYFGRGRVFPMCMACFVSTNVLIIRLAADIRTPAGC